MLRLLSCLFFSLYLPAPVMAWNAEGHMVVAQIAYNHLKPAAKAKCDALIAVPLTYASSATSNFITAAVWADDFKGSLGSGIWHYIDIPFSMDSTSTNGVGAASFDVVRAIRQNIATLQDQHATSTTQAVSLRYLLHFLGDIQQPLHCSTCVSAARPAGDAGGNSFSINGTWNNLHSLWDSGGGFLSDSIARPLTASGKTTLSNKVALIEADYPYAPNSGTIPDPMDWASEGFGLARTVSYVGITQNTTPSTSYLNTAQATTEQRMALGGHRLADLLDTILAPDPVQLVSITRTNATFSFSWAAVSGASYRVQWKQQLDESVWHDLTNLTASGSTATFSEAATQSYRFYQVVQ
jgi:hypothetical protein